MSASVFLSLRSLEFETLKFRFGTACFPQVAFTRVRFCICHIVRAFSSRAATRFARNRTTNMAILVDCKNKCKQRQ